MTDRPGCARAVVDGSAAELAADLLWFLGATAVGERALGALVELEAGFATPADAEAAVLALGERGVVAEVVDAGPALDAALDAWMAHARPVRVGRLHVRPGWLAPDDEPPGAGESVVVLDPTRAFGSGSHPSTRACLAAVERWAAAGKSVLDVGCGTGVLAVAAAALGATPVVAVDIDEVSVAATAGNAAANGVGEVVTARRGTVAAVDGAFDLVLANVGAGVVVDAAADLAARVAPGGHLVVAGLYEDRAEEVSCALVAEGLVFEGVEVEDGWACLIHHSPRAVEHTVHPRHAGGARRIKEHDEPT